MTATSADVLPDAASSADGSRFALSMRGVAKEFATARGVVSALAGVDLDIDHGEFVAVVGASGCGKSTLLNVVAGLDQPSGGTLQRSDQVALMFQDATLLPWLTARQNVELALRLRGVPAQERRAEVDRLLALVRLGGAGVRRPHELSGGMRQRVALARCLAQGTRIIAMDEPLGALDAMTRDHLHDEIERITTGQALTVLLVTHNMREAIRLADRVVLMAAGRIVHEQLVGLLRPRVMDSPEVATRAAELTARLRCAGPGGVA
jgi:NitT/TauT family transport system ATP-binding protein